MNFDQAIAALDGAGHMRVARRKWLGSDHWLAKRGDQVLEFFHAPSHWEREPHVGFYAVGDADEYLASTEDRQATDWVILYRAGADHPDMPTEDRAIPAEEILAHGEAKNP